MRLHRRWYRAIDDVNMLSALVFTPDSVTLISAGGEPHGLRFWDVERGESRDILAETGTNEQITALGLRPDGRVLAIGQEDGTVSLRDMVAHTNRTLPTGHGSAVTMLAFSPGGRYLASGGLYRTLHIWDMGDIVRPCFSLPGECWSNQGVAFSPDGRYLATIGDDDAVSVWALETTQRVAVFHDTRVESSVVAFHPTGAYLAIAGVEQTLTFWYPQENRSEILFTGYNNSPSSLTFDRTGAYLFLGMFSDDVPVRVWSMEPRQQAFVVVGDSDEGCHLTISPDGRFLACRALGNTASIEVWERMPE